MDLKDIIYKYRMEHDLTMDEFSKRCGVSKGYISMIEAGRNAQTGKPIKPTLATLTKIAKGMGVTLDALLEAMETINVSLEPSPSPIDTYDEELLAELQRLHDDKDLRMLLSATKNLTKEDVRFMADLARRMHASENRED